MKKKISLIFLGRGKIASNCFNILNQSFFKNYFEIKAIVSNKQFLLNNKKYISKSTVQILNNLNNENKIFKIIKQKRINLLISVLHPWILSDKILKEINYKAFNLHNGDLPKYKGWNTTAHTIINDEKNIPTLIHRMVKNVDEGSIALQKKIKINKNMSAKKLYSKIIDAASLNFNNFLIKLIKNKINFTKISNGGKFYKKKELELLKKLKIKLTKKQYKIVLGSYMPPYEPAYLKHDKKKIYLLPEISFKKIIIKQKKIN